MRIYIACLASYNNGVLHGRWIDASTDVDDMQAEVDAMLRESKFPNVMVEDPETGEMVPSAEEYAIHDYDGAWPDFGEYPGLEKIAEYMELVEFGVDECGMSEELIREVVDHYGRDYLDAAKDALEGYQGHHDSLADYAADLIEQTGDLANVPDSLRNYIDYAAYGRDMELSGDIFTIRMDGGFHVFWNH